MTEEQKDKLKMLLELETIVGKLTNNVERWNTSITEKNFIALNFPKVVNNFLFYSISARDILSTEILYFKSNDNTEKNLLKRNLCLLMYEFIDDLNYYSGKDFAMDLKKLPNCINLLKENETLKLLSKSFRDTYRDILSEIRHNTIGHKDRNAQKLLNIIASVDSLFIEEMLLEMIRINRKIIKLEDMIILETTNLLDKHITDMQKS